MYYHQIETCFGNSLTVALVMYWGPLRHIYISTDRLYIYSNILIIHPTDEHRRSWSCMKSWFKPFCTLHWQFLHFVWSWIPSIYVDKKHTWIAKNILSHYCFSTYSFCNHKRPTLKQKWFQLSWIRILFYISYPLLVALLKISHVFFFCCPAYLSQWPRTLTPLPVERQFFHPSLCTKKRVIIRPWCFGNKKWF